MSDLEWTRENCFEFIRKEYKEKTAFLNEKIEWEKEKEFLDDEIKKLEAERDYLNTSIESLLGNEYFGETIYDDKDSFKSLMGRREQLDQGKLDQAYSKCLKKLLEEIRDNYLMPKVKFKVTENEKEIETTDQKYYSIYGLIIHAFLKKTSHEEIYTPQDIKELVDEVLGKFELEFNDEGDAKPYIEEYAEKAFSLSHQMLTMLPPLLVCLTTTDPIKGQSLDVLFEKNRLTWLDDQATVSQYNGVLYYYRPAVVYGNQLHVAVKGLVGNSSTRILDSNDVPKSIETIAIKGQESYAEKKRKLSDNNLAPEMIEDAPTETLQSEKKRKKDKQASAETLPSEMTNQNDCKAVKTEIINDNDKKANVKEHLCEND